METVNPQILEEAKPAEKTAKLIQYTGVWMDGVSGNLPVLCVHPDFEKLIEPFLATLDDKIIKASIRIEERPLITRLNIRGLKDTVLSLLHKVSS